MWILDTVPARSLVVGYLERFWKKSRLITQKLPPPCLEWIVKLRAKEFNSYYQSPFEPLTFNDLAAYLPLSQLLRHNPS